MAEKPDESSVFTPLAALTGVLLLAAAAAAWMQGMHSAAGDPARSTLAALSQSVALEASRLRGGDTAAIDALARDLEGLGAARERAVSVPGDAADWQALQSNAAAIVGRRAALETVAGAARDVRERTPDLLAAADALLETSGATAALTELQRRAMALSEAASQAVGSRDPQRLASSLAENLAYTLEVRDALAGSQTTLDIAALAEADRVEALTPLDDALDTIEAAASTVLENVPAIAGLDREIDALLSAADALRPAVAGADQPRSLGLLGHPYVVPGLLGVALLLVLTLAILHARSAVFERTAKFQAEQNDRNQKAILRLLDELGSLADGDLTVEATVTEDITGAIADSINYAIEKLRELVATINETAIMVDSAAKQTESTAVHMARAADNQNREITAATESIESMAASIEEVSGNAERSSDVARHSVDVAHKGGDAVRRTIDGMNTIRETIQETSKRIKRLGESSQEIGNIVELINDIAEQTNILALNASIQASMAGEAGRGFAVVADEVQRLAERSTNATKQIEVLVRTIQADTNEAVISMERSTTDVVGGALLAENAGAALDEIEQVSNQIASLVQNISGSARQQASSAADVTRRTTKLKEISAQTGKATTATAAAISKLSELASQLRKTVDGFTLPSSALEERKLTAVAEPRPVRAAGDKVAG